jgi:hypothetical protein
MNNLTPYLAVWSFFALIVLVLAIYRKMLSTREDDSIHVSAGTAGLVGEQVANAQRIEVVEKWGKLLTAVVVVAGLAIASVYFYGIFQTGTTTVAVQ